MTITEAATGGVTAVIATETMITIVAITTTGTGATIAIMIATGTRLHDLSGG